MTRDPVIFSLNATSSSTLTWIASLAQAFTKCPEILTTKRQCTFLMLAHLICNWSPFSYYNYIIYICLVVVSACWCVWGGGRMGKNVCFHALSSRWVPQEVRWQLEAEIPCLLSCRWWGLNLDPWAWRQEILTTEPSYLSCFYLLSLKWK